MILVFVEHGPDGLVDTSLETIRFARDLGAAGGGIPVDVVGVGVAQFADVLGAHGVRTAYDLVGDDVSAYGASAWAAGVEMHDGSAGLCRSDRFAGNVVRCDRKIGRHARRVHRACYGAGDDHLAPAAGVFGCCPSCHPLSSLLHLTNTPTSS